MDRGLDTKTLEDAMSALFRCTKVEQFFVIANDEMKTINFKGPFPYAIIQNIDNASLPGTHWVCYYVTKRKFLLTGRSVIFWDFFDSYGEAPEFYDLNTPPGHMVEYNQVSLQNENSSLCGEYCLHYLFNIACGLSYKKYKNLFLNKRGDSIVKRFFNCITFMPSRLCTRTNQSCSTKKHCLECSK
jgi:hypothetical protein